MPVRSLLLSALLAGLTGCGPLLFIEAEADELCKTLPDFTVPSMPGGQTVSLDTGTAIDLTEQLSGLPTGELDGDLELLSLSLRPTSGVSDLSFVEKAQATVAGSAGEVSLVTYARAPGAGAVPAVELASSARPDLFPYLRQGKVELKATLTAAFPQKEWTLQARACFHLRTRVDYATALGGVKTP